MWSIGTVHHSCWFVWYENTNLQGKIYCSTAASFRFDLFKFNLTNQYVVDIWSYWIQTSHTEDQPNSDSFSLQSQWGFSGRVQNAKIKNDAFSAYNIFKLFCADKTAQKFVVLIPRKRRSKKQGKAFWNWNKKVMLNMKQWNLKMAFQHRREMKNCAKT